MRLERARNSVGVSAGVSSMKILASCNCLVAPVMRGQSSSDNLPLRILPRFTLPTDDNMRVRICSAGISSEKMATEARMPSFNAACSAMLMASVDLPIDGRPAMISRSPPRRPPVLESKSMKPVGRPRGLFGLLYKIIDLVDERAATPARALT